MLDVVLGPFWVWLFHAERPTVAVLAGGPVVLTSVLWYLSGGQPLRRFSSEAAKSPSA